jgi:putative two-component system response regulator
MRQPTVVILQDADDPAVAMEELGDWPQVRLASIPPDAKVLDEILALLPDVLVTCMGEDDHWGRAVIASIREHASLAELPVLVVSDTLDRDRKIELLSLGADDFVARPADALEIRARVHALARRHGVSVAIGLARKELDQTLSDLKGRGEELERLTGRIVEALEHVNFANDSDTGNHIRRVSAYSAMLAEAIACSGSLVDQVRRCAGLHDVGKVGIRGAILRKPGRFTPEEYEEMKTHTTIGHGLLVRAGLPQVACNIALSHHEWWDGNGYPNGIRSTSIPLEARITSVADVYDAIRNKRCYREAKQHHEVRAIMEASAGTQFDPFLLETFFSDEDRIRGIYETYLEP